MSSVLVLLFLRGIYNSKRLLPVWAWLPRLPPFCWSFVLLGSHSYFSHPLIKSSSWRARAHSCFPQVRLPLQYCLGKLRPTSTSRNANTITFLVFLGTVKPTHTPIHFKLRFLFHSRRTGPPSGGRVLSSHLILSQRFHVIWGCR